MIFEFLQNEKSLFSAFQLWALSPVWIKLALKVYLAKYAPQLMTYYQVIYE